MAKGKSSSPSDKENPKASAVAGDDRNLVAIDEAYKEASLEDRLYLFWDKYQKPLVFSAILLIVGLIFWQVIGYIGERMEAKIRSEYAAIASTEDRLKFAQQRSGHLLSAVAFLELADEAKDDGNFRQAADFFAEAGQRFGDHPMGGRAVLSQGLALWQAGDSSEARRVLNDLQERSAALSTFREEARLVVAMMTAADGESATALQMIRAIIEETENPIIRQRAEMIKNGLE